MARLIHTQLTLNYFLTVSVCELGFLNVIIGYIYIGDVENLAENIRFASARN